MKTNEWIEANWHKLEQAAKNVSRGHQLWADLLNHVMLDFLEKPKACDIKKCLRAELNVIQNKEGTTYNIELGYNRTLELFTIVIFNETTWVISDLKHNNKIMHSFFKELPKTEEACNIIKGLKNKNHHEIVDEIESL